MKCNGLLHTGAHETEHGCGKTHQWTVLELLTQPSGGLLGPPRSSFLFILTIPLPEDHPKAPFPHTAKPLSPRLARD